MIEAARSTKKSSSLPKCGAVLLALFVLACQPREHDAVGPEPALRVGVGVGSALLPFIKDAAATVSSTAREREPRVEEARSSAAIRKLVDGELGLAFTSRPVRASELSLAAKKKGSLHMVVLGMEALAVIVHPDNPLRDLSSEQLRALFFAGDMEDWSELTAGEKQGPIHVLAVSPKTSGTAELFAASVAGDEKKPYVASARFAESSDATVGRVAADPDAISFTGSANVTGRVRALALDHVSPTEKSVLDASYALSRKLFAISNGPPRGQAREFIKLLLSARGQRIARENGVIPIALD